MVVKHGQHQQQPPAPPQPAPGTGALPPPASPTHGCCWDTPPHYRTGSGCACPRSTGRRGEVPVRCSCGGRAGHRRHRSVSTRPMAPTAPSRHPRASAARKCNRGVKAMLAGECPPRRPPRCPAGTHGELLHAAGADADPVHAGSAWRARRAVGPGEMLRLADGAAADVAGAPQRGTGWLQVAAVPRVGPEGELALLQHRVDAARQRRGQLQPLQRLVQEAVTCGEVTPLHRGFPSGAGNPLHWEPPCCIIPWPLSKKSVMKRALHGDHISPGSSEERTGAITRRAAPERLFSSWQGWEVSCSMLKTWPVPEDSSVSPRAHRWQQVTPSSLLAPPAHPAHGRP